MSTIHSRIKEQRLKLGYTLAQIADMLNVKEATVQRYESGEIRNLKHDTIVNLANILKCSPCYLMGWNEQEPQNDIDTQYDLIISEIPILEKYIKLNSLGQEKADSYISDLIENPKYVSDAEQIDTGYASIAADTGKNGRVKAPDIDTIIALNKDE